MNDSSVLLEPCRIPRLCGVIPVKDGKYFGLAVTYESYEQRAVRSEILIVNDRTLQIDDININCIERALGDYTILCCETSNRRRLQITVRLL